MRVAYKGWDPKPESLAMVRIAQDIVDDYQRRGFSLTLRQLYYQFVARGHLDNTERNYKKLGTVLDNARMAGLIDWSAIEDRTRHPRGNQHWRSPEQIIEAVGSSYRIDKWADQPNYVEVWVEKEALDGIVSQVARQLDVTSFACRGYVSSSAMYRAAQRIGWEIEAGKNVTVIHLGDHDPSGLDMTRDNLDRLELMASQNAGSSYWDGGLPRLEVRRVALNMDQVEAYDPPPNPAKMTDSRAEGYVAEHGQYSWELDALDPTTLADLIRSHVDGLRDEDLYQAQVDREEQVRSELGQLSETGWEATRRFLASIDSHGLETVQAALRELED